MSSFAPRGKRGPYKKVAAKKAAKKAAAKAQPKPPKAPPPEKPGSAKPKFKVPAAALVPWMAMTQKQQAFVAAFVKCGDAKIAAAAGGYTKPADSAALLRQPNVVAFLAALKPAQEEVGEVVADAAWIRQRFIAEATSAPEGAVRVRALENLAELTAMYPPKNIKLTTLPPSLEALKAALDDFGAETGLPAPQHGQLAH